MNCLYYCSTPFQVLNALNMSFNHVLASDKDNNKIVIVIVNCFSSASSVATVLREEGLFDDVYLVGEEDQKSRPNDYKKVLMIAHDVFFPKRLLKQQFKREKLDFLINQFDVIVSSVFSHSIACLRMLNRNASYYMMDDGLGSYFGNLITQMRSSGYRYLLWFRNMGENIMLPKALYVMQKSICCSTMATDVYQLPEFSPNFLKIAFKVFSIPERVHAYKHEIIWLSQKYNRVELINHSRRVTEVLREYRKNVIVRLHPLETDRSIYEGLDIDQNGYFWELFISKLSISKYLLITDFSTAVFTPKLLYDQEPWILFTYKLIPAFDNDDKEIFEGTKSIAAHLKKSYTHPERICEPNTWDEFKRFIEQYLSVNEVHN